MLGRGRTLAQGATPAASAQDEPAQESDRGQWLLVLLGDVAVASATELVLVAEPRVVAFTASPDRQVRVLDTSTVIEDAWAEGSSFRQDPPNAVVADDDSDRLAVVTIEDVAQQGAVLTLSYRLLEGQLPAVGDHAILTIDPFHFGPGPGDG